MVTPIGREHATTHRPRFHMRQLTVAFGLVVSGVLGLGLVLKALLPGSAIRPGAVALLGLVLAATALVVIRRRNRGRALQRGADASCAPAAPAAPGQLRFRSEEEPADEDVYLADDPDVDPDEFEHLVALLCERDGCRDVRVVGGAHDLGADVLAVTPDGRRLVIQCKQYDETNRVGSQDLQRFGGTCFTVHEADIAAVVTTSTFTEPALGYAEQSGIRCLDHDTLFAWEAGTGPAPWQTGG
ncbi:restriction endonuclease [Streptomyces sp. NPDC048516]|uniref:restriction endonuclease n=1 Tax=Streptomyces sp. NPDC048516 TaxID=3365565 RepID=UPI00371A4BF9